ncbi:arylesterase/monooxygenase [Ilyonectria destructans]|nr:arylesterase/monooxygenase [Ilyonectria destructans]
MPLAYDPEFVRALEPLVPGLTQWPDSPEAHDIATRRVNVTAMFGPLRTSHETHADIAVSTFSVKSHDGADVEVLHLRKRGSETEPPTPAILHVHGGGMIAGTARDNLKPLEAYVHDIGIQIFSVEYRLAPEHQHPTLVEDCYAALRYISEEAQALNVDPARLAVLGESAGGGIAAALALMARDRGLTPRLAKQILIYPMLDDRTLEPAEDLDPLAVWKSVDNVTGWTALLGQGNIGRDRQVSPYAAPARVPSVAGLPPTYIDVGELDIFRDEDIEYALRLLKAGVSTEFHLYPGLPHGFDLLAPDISAVRRAAENRLKAIEGI